VSGKAIGRLRTLGIIEGISLLVLLVVAMPLKYLYGMPEVVKYVGWAHGLLFMLLCAQIVQVMLVCRWPLSRAIAPFAAAVVPFGFIAVDGWLARQATATAPAAHDA
jgi:integral membrane protein